MTDTETTAATSVVGPLDEELVAAYRRDGFVVVPPGFVPGVVEVALGVLPAVLDVDSPARILERDGVTVRSVYGVHQSSPELAAVSASAGLVGAVRQLLGGDEVYVHQSKVNIKAPFAGDQWEWHQDYIYWLHGDGIHRPDLVNVAIFLDEVTEFNGPLTFIRGSHTRGVLSATDTEGMPLGYENAPAWVATLTAEEKFQVPAATIEELARATELVSPKGPAGSVLFFSPNILHSSAANISPFGRTMLMYIYNSIHNPATTTNPRPPFLAEPQPTPLQPI